MKNYILLTISLSSFYFSKAQTIEIKPNSKTTISPNSNKTTTKITPAINSSSNLVMTDSLKNIRSVMGIPKRGFTTDWIFPKQNEITKLLLYNKAEIGIHFPDSLTNYINAFINAESEKKTINPFDPDQIEVYAQLELLEGLKWIEAGKIFGFYYQEFDRNTRSTNIETWSWDKIKTEDYFRIRFAPTKVGKWRITTFVKLKGKELAKMGPFEFSTVNAKNKGYLKVAKDKKHFTLGNEPFIPVGQNLPKPTCYIEKDSAGKIINDPFKCATCPCAGIEDWCGHLKNLPMHPKAYLTYHDELNNLKKSGANYFRMINFPFTYEIEYEQLGNYSNRMNCAWELDKLIEKAEKLDLKINFNLFVGYPLLKNPYGVNLWDWYQDNEGDKGYCYRNELELKNPIEFLTNPIAKKYFKNRIRYYIARYGYSTSIGIIELVSEINSKFPNNPIEVFQWHEEMSNFIKNELNHTNQLLGVNYDGDGPNEAKGDLSYSIKSVDVLGHNIHRAGIYRSDLIKTVERYKKYEKPIIFSEIGTGDSGLESCDNHTEWIKDLWFSLFTGSATTGINWNLQHDYKTWNNFRNIRQFLYQINLANFPKTTSQIRKDHLAEMLYMIDSASKKSFGVIQNTTWNFFTQGTGKCKTLIKTSKEFTKFSDVKSIAGKKGLFLIVSPNQEYQLDWYNPLTGKNIDSTITITATKKGKITLNHPNLTSDLPFVAFKLYTKEEPFTRALNNKINKKGLSPLELPSNQNKKVEIQEK